MWYHSALVLNLVEITMRSFTQLLTAVAIYLIFAILNAVIFGLLFDMIDTAQQRASDFQNELDDANTAMVNLGLSSSIKARVRSYILQTRETNSEQRRFISFSDTMPPPKNRALNQINFKRVLYKSHNMIALRLSMRDQYRN